MILRHAKSVTNLTSEQLREAAAVKDQIEALEAKLAGLLSGSGESSAPAAPVPGKRRGRKPGSKNKPKASAESAASESAAPTAKKKAKRQMSPEGRARIIAAQKARWAKIKKGK
ncbi:MAG: hypothetical protein KDN22_20930 [Verrucomicrobiae bacterium]|nr:hypothetical protein [Verrucomicrobiae bacterium]